MIPINIFLNTNQITKKFLKIWNRTHIKDGHTYGPGNLIIEAKEVVGWVFFMIEIEINHNFWIIWDRDRDRCFGKLTLPVMCQLTPKLTRVARSIEHSMVCVI